MNPFSLVIIGVIILICVVVGVIASLSIFSDWQIEKTLRKNGVTAEAQITKLDKKFLQTARSGGGKRSQRLYSVDYQFKVAAPGQAEKLYNGSFPIRRDAYEALTVGGTIYIRYLPDSPDVSRPDGSYRERGLFDALPLPVLGGLIVVVIIAILVVGPLVNNAMSQRNLADFNATVTAAIAADLTEIHTAIDSRLEGWGAKATSTLQQVSPKEAGFAASTRMRALLYGKCAGDHFYLYVIWYALPSYPVASSTEANLYAYTPGVKPQSCLPGGWEIIPERTFNDYGGDWYGISVLYAAGTIRDGVATLPPK